MIRDQQRRYDPPARSADLIEHLVRTGQPIVTEQRAAQDRKG
jgi:hypothetical protein